MSTRTRVLHRPAVAAVTGTPSHGERRVSDQTRGVGDGDVDNSATAV